jgi:hypothetical protein
VVGLLRASVTLDERHDHCRIVAETDVPRSKNAELPMLKKGIAAILNAFSRAMLNRAFPGEQ